MTIARGFAVTAMLAGLTLALAAPAAAANEMSGHYLETDTTPDGRQTTNDYYFTPCGDGCALVSDTPGGPTVAQAHLVNGQWTMDTLSDAGCPDGTSVPNALLTHRTWDPNALAGTNQVSLTVPACGNPGGFQETNNLQFKQAA